MQAMEQQPEYDLFIIGGGINGCGVARDAAGRGLKVFLAEKNDLASGTSSASSKLIHGGLRYLEHYEFRLVREALAEREVLLKIAPHIVKPLKFTLPHRPHLRPAWMIRSGLFLYDHLSKRNSLPPARTVKLDSSRGMRDGIKTAFEYYDCAVDDARLVISNAISARAHGAEIRTQQEVIRVDFIAKRKLWRIESFNSATRTSETHLAKHVINAAGPWLNKVFTDAVQEISPARNIRLIKGSHIIVPRVPNGDSAFILQNEDRRIVFVLPYKDDLSIIGTTDKEYTGSLEKICIDKDEIDYLLEVHNLHFKHQLQSEDIVATYSGVRPLCDDESSDPSAITRDYTITKTESSPTNSIVSIYGGKITTYRKLANAVMDELNPYYPSLRQEWTHLEGLPGARQVDNKANGSELTLEHNYPWLNTTLAKRYSECYGSQAELFLDSCSSTEDLGRDYGFGLTEKELEYLITNEWATTADDILYRRTKLGYRYSKIQVEQLIERLQCLSLEQPESNKTSLA